MQDGWVQRVLDLLHQASDLIRNFMISVHLLESEHMFWDDERFKTELEIVIAKRAEVTNIDKGILIVSFRIIMQIENTGCCHNISFVFR